MTQTLSGKTALITGAASGIGAACAAAFADAGADVLLADLAGTPLTVDVSDEQSVIAMAGEIGALDIVVNSAGILLERSLEDMTAEEFDRVIAVNLRGTFLIGKYTLPRIRAGGRFIAVTSELAQPGRADFSAYVASKAGVIGLVKSWAREYAPDILVNALAPGPTDTPMLDLENMSAEARAEDADNPLGRVGRPDEIAAVACFLAGPDASFMTGQTVSPNGGAVMF